MTGLSNRQTQIIKALVEEYISTAEPVGSLALERKYSLGVSPATIRNEMMNLTKMGYLRQPHTSAGRVPTPLAMKFYISQLMEEKHLSLADEVQAKEEIRDRRGNFDKAMAEATQVLADQTKSLAVAATDDGDVWRAGYSYIYDSPEFRQNVAMCQQIFVALEEAEKIHQLFFGRLTGLVPVEVLFEIDWPYSDEVSVVATKFDIYGHKGAIGVVSPLRRSPSVIPNVRLIRSVFEEIFK